MAIYELPYNIWMVFFGVWIFQEWKLNCHIHRTFTKQLKYWKSTINIQCLSKRSKENHLLERLIVLHWFNPSCEVQFIQKISWIYQFKSFSSAHEKHIARKAPSMYFLRSVSLILLTLIKHRMASNAGYTLFINCVDLVWFDFVHWQQKTLCDRHYSISCPFDVFARDVHQSRWTRTQNFAA